MYIKNINGIEVTEEVYNIYNEYMNELENGNYEEEFKIIATKQIESIIKDKTPFWIKKYFTDNTVKQCLENGYKHFKK